MRWGSHSFTPGRCSRQRSAPPAESSNRDGEKPIVDRPETTDEATITEAGTELERTIGLTGGIAIGIGTMVGAGIFVFPGIAAGQAGPAAAGSFAIGAVVALLVALPTSELATTMPRSGGGYYFISRGMESLFGAVVGLSLWFGLVFASAFYLVGFGFYADAVLARLGVSLGGFDVAVPLALVFGAFLTVLNATGTENATKLQNGVVGILLAIIVAFLTFGGLSALGLIGDPEPIGEPFLSKGAFSVLTTAALVFTSYLGFAQVATVAGEIKRPGLISRSRWWGRFSSWASSTWRRSSWRSARSAASASPPSGRRRW